MAAGTTFVNYSDLWWNPDESGWGLNISQQADTLFGTLFVYGQGEQAVWYSVTLIYQSTGSNGGVTYDGTLYETSGPPLGTPFNPALLNRRAVGTATLTFGDDAHALLRYSVDHIVVTKSITRQTFSAQTLDGSYIGSTSDETYDCKNPSRDGLVTTDPGPFTIGNEGEYVVLRFPTCTITGKYTQQGQIGLIDGIYECTNHAVGEIRFTGMQTAKGGIVGNYVGRDSSCSFRGNVGGMRLLE
ncbi:MAG: hypothetical protein IT518_26195 [Burkholderiales bacterium]|nr:hypothetical protein [Burkholderiales bacterium]